MALQALEILPEYYFLKKNMFFNGAFLCTTSSWKYKLGEINNLIPYMENSDVMIFKQEMSSLGCLKFGFKIDPIYVSEYQS